MYVTAPEPEIIAKIRRVDACYARLTLDFPRDRMGTVRRLVAELLVSAPDAEETPALPSPLPAGDPE